MPQSVQPNLTPEEEQNTRLAVQDTVLRYLIGVLGSTQSQAFSNLLNSTCENLVKQPPRDSPGAMIQREYMLHLLKSYLPNR